MKKKILSVFFVFFLMGSFFLIKRNFYSKKNQFILKTVKRGTLVKKISASGKVKAEREINLKFQTAGRLAWVGVKEGDWVNQWQAIAQLDTRELQKRLEKALRDYSKERWDFEQEREDQGVTTDDLDKHTLTNEARRILEKNQFDLEKAVLDVELKDIALRYATLITPIAGIVTRVDTPVAGVNITPAKAIFQIADPSSVYFSANIDEVDIGKITLGQKAKITLDAYPEKIFESKVKKIAFKATTTTGGGTAFKVEIPLPQNNNFQFKLGMNGDVEIILEEKENALFVPSSAIMKRGEKKFVWIVEKGKAKKREVKVGMETDEEVEILEGVNEGDKIIAESISKIKEGERVE